MNVSKVTYSVTHKPKDAPEDQKPFTIGANFKTISEAEKFAREQLADRGGRVWVVQYLFASIEMEIE